MTATRYSPSKDFANLATVAARALASASAKPALVLNPAQAEAVYSAMCALNNVGGRLHAFVGNREEQDDDRAIEVHEGRLTGNVYVAGLGRREEYESQHDFATAYGLSTGA